MDSMYIILVNRIPGIRDRYKKKRSHSRGTVGRIGAWTVSYTHLTLPTTSRV